MRALRWGLPGVLVAVAVVSAGSAHLALAAPWAPRPTDVLQLDISSTPTISQMRGPFTMMELDGFDTAATTVRELHALGKKAVCYIDVGTWEDWRPDASHFPRTVLGRGDQGWAGERWLDIRRQSLLLPLMSARMKMCARKGFDAVDPDNVDGVENATGFPLTTAEQYSYDRAIAALAHSMGLAVALKSYASAATALEPSFDFVVDEECVVYDECGSFRAFIEHAKPVFDIEYTSSLSFCTALPHGVRGIAKRLSLNAWVRWCA